MQVHVRLLGGFEVSVDGRPVPPTAWGRRRAASLVKVLAMTPSARLHRERLMDVLWPELAASDAGPRLHKAAHFARQALGHRDALVLRDDVVAFFPEADVDVDALRFEAAAQEALRTEPHEADACEAALALYRGELLPDDLYEEWTGEERSRLRTRYRSVLAAARRWEDVLRADPADEHAHVELLREAVAAHDRAGALRRYDLLARLLMEELGVPPTPEADALRERALALSSDDRSAPRARRSPQPLGAVAPDLLEREEPLVELVDALEAALGAGRGTVVLVAGEAGSGKTSLLSAFLEGVPSDVDVVAGGCDDLLASRSLGPFRDMAQAHPGVAATLEGAHGDDVLGGLLAVMAARPTVMVIEDVHWADDATLDAIRYLSRRIGGMAALLILTVRQDEIDPGHPLRRLLGGLTGPSVRRLSLAPLSVQAVGRLAAGATSATGAIDVEELHRVTKGNAFFVSEVLARGGAEVPSTVRDAVLARTSSLAPEARNLIERLSVVPGRAERWLARALAGDDDDVVVRAERSGVLTGTSTHVAFRHELARRAVETSLTVGERIRANADVARALLANPPLDAPRIVHHAEQAGRTDLLVRYGPAAAEDAIRFGAHRQAAETLRHVLDHGDELAPAEVARLLTQQAYSLYVVNEFEAARDCAERAVGFASATGDVAALADALSAVSKASFWAIGPSRAREASRQAVELLSGADDPVRLAVALTDLARAHSNLATVGTVAEPAPEGQAVAERALDLAERLDRDDLRSQALSYVGSCRLANGDRRGFADLAAAVALNAEDPRAELRVRARVNAAGSLHRAGRPDEALRHVAAGLRLAPDVEFLAGEYRLRLTEAAVHVNQGEWDRAVTELRGLVASDRNPGVMRHLAGSLLIRLLARRGEPGGQEWLDAALADPVSGGDSFVAGPLAIAQVELRWLTAATGPLPPNIDLARRTAARVGHRTVQAELCAYLRRAGYPAAEPDSAPGPWADVLAGRWRGAAAAWAVLGDRYERALELALHGDEAARGEGVAELGALGARATVQTIERQRRRPGPASLPS